MRCGIVNGQLFRPRNTTSSNLPSSVLPLVNNDCTDHKIYKYLKKKNSQEKYTYFTLAFFDFKHSYVTNSKHLIRFRTSDTLTFLKKYTTVKCNIKYNGFLT